MVINMAGLSMGCGCIVNTAGVADVGGGCPWEMGGHVVNAGGDGGSCH